MTDVIAVMLCAGICWRIICYRRKGAQYRPFVSVAAYLVAMAAGCYGLSIALGPAQGQTSPFLLVLLALFAVMVFRSGGNVARVLRVHWDD